MRNISVGHRLYLSVTSIFFLFAIALILFQQNREHEYKVTALKTELYSYNDRIHDAIAFFGQLKGNEQAENYLTRAFNKDIRITIINPRGKVLYDNRQKNLRHLNNHLTRSEVAGALRHGRGYTVERRSATTQHPYFYAATYYKDENLIIRTARIYDYDLLRILHTDQHFIWFSLFSLVVLTIILYQFIRRLDRHINLLRSFATRADHNESLDSQDLAAFPNDELGEIAERIIKMYKRLQSTRKEQDILKRQLTQNVAHELKTPIASIQGYIETLINNPGMSDETKQQFLQRCLSQSQRLTALLRDISTLNRMDDASDLMAFEPVDLALMVESIRTETALMMKERAMTMDVHLPQHLVVRGNPSLLYSIFRNLTDNAIAYAGPNTTITLTMIEEESKWRFTFMDNGVGVPAEHLPRLFERFYRIDKGRSRKLGGTGLGLAIVKNAVIVHGGVIRVENNEGGGLRFDFTLKK